MRTEEQGEGPHEGWSEPWQVRTEEQGEGPHGGWSTPWQMMDREKVLMEAGVRHGR